MIGKGKYLLNSPKRDESSPKSRSVGIQCLRAIAVVSVLLYHLAPSIFPNGYLGVDIFFVVSGYLIIPRIVNVLVGKSGFILALKYFYKRRVFRLLPAHLVTVLVTLFLVLIFSKPEEHKLVSGQAIASLFLLANYGAQYFVGDYFNHGRNALLHLWSLALEEQVYLLLPLALYLIARICTLFVKKQYVGRTGNTNFFKFILIILTFLSFSISFSSRYFGFPFRQSFFGFPSEEVFYFASSRFWEFGLGGILALNLGSNRKQDSQTGKFFSYAYFCILASLLAFPIHTFPQFVRQFADLIFVLLTLLCLSYFKKFDFKLSAHLAPLHFIGDISYSLYLVHYPIILICRYSPVEFMAQERNFFRVASVPISLVLAVLLHKKVEKPFMFLSTEKNNSSNYQKRIFFLYMIALACSISVFFSSLNNYFGLNPNPKHLFDAGQLDKECERDGNSKPCVYGKGDTKSLLIGDSQARAISQAFIDFKPATSGQTLVWTKAGCPFLLEEVSRKILNTNAIFALGAKDRNQHSCLEHNSRVYQYIVKNRIHTIFIAQRSSSRFLEDFNVAPNDYNSAVIESILILSKIKTLKGIFWIGPSLEFPDAQQFFSGNLLLWQKPYIPPTFFSRSLMRPFSFDDEDFIESKLSNHSKITFLRMSPVFCDLKICKRWKSGWLFADMDHLSINGANYLFRALFYKS